MFIALGLYSLYSRLRVQKRPWHEVMMTKPIPTEPLATSQARTFQAKAWKEGSGRAERTRRRSAKRLRRRAGPGCRLFPESVKQS